MVNFAAGVLAEAAVCMCAMAGRDVRGCCVRDATKNNCKLQMEAGKYNRISMFFCEELQL